MNYSSNKKLVLLILNLLVIFNVVEVRSLEEGVKSMKKKESNHHHQLQSQHHNRHYYRKDSLKIDDSESGGGVSMISSGQQHQPLAFDKQSENVTIKVGQQAVLPCFVNNIGSHKVIWSKNGDILSLGSIKINSDQRLNIQHRYVSEWHLIIDDVITDDEGEYICKTNGNFYKTINLQVLMPPTIDDINSTPAGALVVKEGSSTTLRCFADAKPDPVIKWYKWKKYKNLVSEKEELSMIGNEITISSIKRTDANMFECIAKNSVPPATSRIFNLEIQFIPTVELDVRKTFQFLNKKIMLECKVSSNPVDKVYWYKNGIVFTDQGQQMMAPPTNQQLNYISETSDEKNFKVNSQDISNINEHYKILLTLTINNAKEDDFGEYQCCAVNFYGQTCSNIFVQEIKNEKLSLTTLKLNDNKIMEPFSTPSLKHQSTNFNKNKITKTMNDSISKYEQSMYALSNFQSNNSSGLVEQLSLDEVKTVDKEIVDDENLLSDLASDEESDDKKLANDNSLDSKDKRRHYLIKSKHLHSESLPTSSSTTIKNCSLTLSFLITIIISVFKA